MVGASSLSRDITSSLLEAAQSPSNDTSAAHDGTLRSSAAEIQELLHPPLELRDVWVSADPLKLYNLAQAILEKELWRPYLSMQEYEVLRLVLDAQDATLWRQLLDGQLTFVFYDPEPKKPKPVEHSGCAAESATPGPEWTPEPSVGPQASQDTETDPARSATPVPNSVPSVPTVPNSVPASTPNSTANPAAPAADSDPGTTSGLHLDTKESLLRTANTHADPVTMAFKLRYMLFEKSLDVVFPDLLHDKNMDLEVQERGLMPFGSETPYRIAGDEDGTAERAAQLIDYRELLKPFPVAEADAEEAKSAAKSGIPAPEQTGKPAEDARAARDEEDDYDDDDDDDDEEGEKENKEEKEEEKGVNGSGNEKEKEKENSGATGGEGSGAESGVGGRAEEMAGNTEMSAEGENSELHGFPAGEGVFADPETGRKYLKVRVRNPTATEIKKHEDSVKQTLGDVFHGYEYDKESILKRKQLEESDRQMDNDTEDMKLGSINLGAANLSLKHLLSSIEEKRDALGMSDAELKNLILDVRKNRSKWASDDKIGQEELYEAAEKVVLELRGYTEHSTAFLNKVSKRDAPNYFNIIKQPMDLNTVMKKLKTFQYKSKKEFVDNLMLIWQNCLTYNSDPKHFLRAHAIAMQKKTLTLIPLIPDIVVRDKSEVAAETGTPAPEDREDTEERTGKKHSSFGMRGSATAGKGEGHKSKKRKHMTPALESSEAAAETPETGPDGAPAGRDVSTAAGSPHAESPEPDEPTNPLNQTEEEREGAENDLYVQTWKNLTGKTRATLSIERGSRFTSDKLQPEARAITSQADRLAELEKQENPRNRRLVYADLDTAESPKRAMFAVGRRRAVETPGGRRGRSGLLEAIRVPETETAVDVALPEYEAGPLVPAVPWLGEDPYHDADSVVQQFLANKGLEPPRSRFAAPTRGLNVKVNENIAEMQAIRKICHKIWVLRQMQTQTFIHQNQLTAYEPESIVDGDVDLESQLPTREAYSDGVARVAMAKATAKLAMHRGFEATDPFVLNALTDVACDYMAKLGRTMQLQLEAQGAQRQAGQKPSVEKMLLLALAECGISGPDVLDLYVEEEIVRFGTKLQEHRKKLSAFLADLLRPGFQLFTDSAFNDNSEQFISGDFSEELGEDFFGFKELGLDKEFNLLTNSVPLHLLHSRLNNSFNFFQGNSRGSNKHKADELSEYPKVDMEIAGRQIELIRPFLMHRVEVYNNHSKYANSMNNAIANMGPGNAPKVLAYSDVWALDDDDLSTKQRNQRPKLPPTGKIIGVKRKLISRGCFLSPPGTESATPAGETETMESSAAAETPVMKTEESF